MTNKHESYLGPPSNTEDKQEFMRGKVAEITPPKLDQEQWGTHIEGLSWDSVDRIFHRASWVSNPFEVLSRLPEHFLSIPLIGFGLDTLLIVVHSTVDCTCLVVVHQLVTYLPLLQGLTQVTAGVYRSTQGRHQAKLCRVYPEGASVFKLHFHW